MADPLELADFYDRSEVTDLAVAPDGERVAFVADEFDEREDERRSSLFVVPSDGSRDPHRLTRASGGQQPNWSPDGSKLAVLATREDDLGRAVGRDDADGDDDESEGDASEEEAAGDADGEAEPKPQVWVFDLERGGDARQVTDRDEGVAEFDWGLDGDRIAFGSRDPTDDQREYLERKREGGPIEVERLQHKANGVGFTDEVTTYVFVADVETGETERLDDAYASGARAPLFGLNLAWAPGERIAFAANRTERPDDDGSMHLYTIDPDGEDLRQVTDGQFQSSAFSWGPRGERIAFVGSDPDNWYRPSELYVARDEPGAYESVSASLDRTIAMFGTPEWTADDRILAPIGDEGLTRLARFDATDDDPEQVFEGQGRDRTIGWGGVDVGGDTVAVHLSDPREGEGVFTVDVEDLGARSDESTRVTAVDETLLAGTETPEARRFTWTHEDGTEIEGVAYLPADFDPDDDPRPVIASIHGGPMSYDAPEFKFDYAYWTGQGYVVYRTNYRGSTSYGREFAESLKGTRGDLEPEDVIGGLEELAGRGWVDPDRAFVTGFSYGGITTANVITREEEPFAAAAAEHGIYDFRSTFGTDDNHLWHEWEFGLPWEVPDTYDDVSSIDDVGNVDTPTLVTAGENDWRCPPSQAEQLYVSIKKQGVPAKLVVYQDEHHDVGDPDRAIHRLETLTEWFEDHDPGEQS